MVRLVSPFLLLHHHNNTQHATHRQRQRDRDTDTETQTEPKYNDRFARQTPFCDVRLKESLTFHNGFMFLQRSLLNIYSFTYVYTRIVKDTTTFEMEMCGCKQATAHAHVQSRCMWLNFERTKNSNRSKKNSQRRKSNANLLNNSQTPEIVRNYFGRHGTHSMFWCTAARSKNPRYLRCGCGHFDQPCLVMNAFGCLARQWDSLHDGLLGKHIPRYAGHLASSDLHEVGLKPVHEFTSERVVCVLFACLGLPQYFLGRLRRKREDIWNLREPLRLGGGIRPEAPHDGQSLQEKRLVPFDFIEIH